MIKFYVFSALLFPCFLNAQNIELSYPFPVKQMERNFTLPEKMDTLNQNYYFVYQFKLQNGKPKSIELVHQSPREIHEDYVTLSEEKLKQFDFKNLINDRNIEWYGTTIIFKKKPIVYQKWSETQLTYEEKLHMLTFSTGKYAGLKKNDFDYMKSKNHKDVMIQISFDTEGKMTFENLTENPETNHDEQYWEIFKKITDGIQTEKFWSDTKNPFPYSENFNIYLNFYKKLGGQ